MKTILITRNRPKYFELTLNSVLHTIPDPTQLIVCINDGCEDTRHIAFERHKTDRFTVRAYTENHGVTVPLKVIEQDNIDPDQWISVIQDDMIIPSNCPGWQNTFVEIANEYDADIVSFSVGLSNVSVDGVLSHQQPTESRGGWDIYRKPAVPLYLMQPGVFKAGFYTASQCPTTGLVTDSTLISNAKTIVLNQRKVYHIGWNESADGYNTRDQWRQMLGV